MGKRKRKNSFQNNKKRKLEGNESSPDWLYLPVELWHLIVLFMRSTYRTDNIYNLRLVNTFFRLRVLAPGMNGFVQKISLNNLPEYYETLYKFEWLKPDCIPDFNSGYHVYYNFVCHLKSPEFNKLKHDLEKYKIHSISFKNRYCIMDYEMAIFPDTLKEITLPRHDHISLGSAWRSNETPRHGGLITPIVSFFATNPDQIKFIKCSRSALYYFRDLFEILGLDVKFGVDQAYYYALPCALKYIKSVDFTRLIEKCGDKVNMTDSLGYCPFRVALTNNRSEYYLTFLEVGGDPIYQIRNKIKDEAFICQAIRQRNVDFLLVLIESNYNLFPEECAEEVEKKIFSYCVRHFNLFGVPFRNFLLDNSQFFRIDPKKLLFAIIQVHFTKLTDPYFVGEQGIHNLVRMIPLFKDEDLLEFLIEKEFKLLDIYRLLWIFRKDVIPLFIKFAYNLSNLEQLPTPEQIEWYMLHFDYRYTTLFYLAFNRLCSFATTDENFRCSPDLKMGLYWIVNFWDPNVNITQTDEILSAILPAKEKIPCLYSSIIYAFNQNQKLLEQLENI